MKTLVNLLAFFLLLWIVFMFYQIYEMEAHIRIQHKKLFDQRTLLLEASDYYLWKQAPIINREKALNVLTTINDFNYKNHHIKVSLIPNGSFCIYRIVLYQNNTTQLFFCLD